MPRQFWGDSDRHLQARLLGQVGGNPINAGLGGLGKAVGIPDFARGTSFAPGGLALVGEHGPELVNLPQGSRVIPNHKLDGGSRGPVQVVVDVRGATGNAEVQAMVATGVKAGMDQVRREVPSIFINHQMRR